MHSHFNNRKLETGNAREEHEEEEDDDDLLVNAHQASSFLCFSSVAFSVDYKCAACNAVAEELERGLSNEKPRNHLDMRHRLDSTGQRRGKLIDYRYEFAELIKKGSIKVGDVSKVLCQDLSEHCSKTSGSYKEDNFDDESDGEL